MRKRLKIFGIYLLIGFTVLAACFFTLRNKYRLVIQDLAQTSVKNATSDLANDAVAQQIENGNIQYDRMVYFEKDVNGKITALKTNIGEINHLKTDILNIINGKILELDAVDIGIPVGSLFLPEFFSGKGPSIPVHILAIRNSDATFSSAFHQAGINQTLHQLLMEVSVDAAGAGAGGDQLLYHHQPDCGGGNGHCGRSARYIHPNGWQRGRQCRLTEPLRTSYPYVTALTRPVTNCTLNRFTQANCRGRLAVDPPANGTERPVEWQ